MQGRYFVVVAAIFIAAPTFAGLFSTSLSADEARQIKRLAVVSVMGDILHGRQVGLTVFQNKSFDASVSDWHFDAEVAKDLVERITVGGKIGGKAVSMVVPATKALVIVREAKAQGFDAVLIVMPEEDIHDRTLGSGVTLLHKKAWGLDRVHPCIVGAMRIFRVSDGKQIGGYVLDPCSYTRNSLVWHDSWEAFSDDEKHATLTTLQEHAIGSLSLALASLKLSEK